MRNGISLSVAVAAVAVGTASAHATIVFSDDFNAAGSASNYNVVQSGTNGITWAWDYSTMGIPAAPGTTDGSTRGVKLESNNGQTGAIAGITLHTNQQFTGRYVVKFDAWMNANGPFPVGETVQGGTGSTEFLTAGVGGNNTAVNRPSATATGSGAWLAYDGEGGSGVDFRLYKGTALQNPTRGQYAAGTIDTPTADNSRNANLAYYSQFGGINVSDLPVQGANAPGGHAQQNGVTKSGATAFEWHQVVMDVFPTGGTGGAPAVSFYIGGLLIGTLDAGLTPAFSTDGRVTVGYADPFASLSDNPALSFGVIDNLVVYVPEPTSLALLGVGALGLLARRRRSA